MREGFLYLTHLTVLSILNVDFWRGNSYTNVLQLSHSSPLSKNWMKGCAIIFGNVAVQTFSEILLVLQSILKHVIKIKIAEFHA